MSSVQAVVNEDEGSRSEFERLIREIRPELHRYCARMTGSVIDGEDVVQETLAKAFAALKENPSVPNLRAWLFRIAHNKAVDYTRDYARRFGKPLEDFPELASTVSAPDARVAAQAGLRPFVSLPPAQRAAVILKDVLGYSLEETAEVLGRTVAMVKGLLHRGRAALRSVIGSSGFERGRLETTQAALLERYVRHFSAREFDALRAMLAEDASLDVIGMAKAHGASETGQYFGRYAGIHDWVARLGEVEGRPGVEVDSKPRYFVLVEWAEGRVAKIRDFRYVPYVMEDCRWSLLEGFAE
jgi:RNA polymerase sigma-70 factor (ECF subfamily)